MKMMLFENEKAANELFENEKALMSPDCSHLK
jgi:hypothetical protein